MPVCEFNQDTVRKIWADTKVKGYAQKE